MQTFIFISLCLFFDILFAAVGQQFVQLLKLNTIVGLIFGVI